MLIGDEGKTAPEGVVFDAPHPYMSLFGGYERSGIGRKDGRTASPCVTK